MTVSGVAVGQWKRIAKKHKGLRSKFVREKIIRAVSLGQVSHTYRAGTFIVRYHNINILVSENMVLTVWRDSSRPPVDVSEESKSEYDEKLLQRKYGGITQYAS